MDTASRFRDFAAAADLGGSAVYAAWATGVAGDAEIIALVDTAAPSQRQPVLVFAVARTLGASLDGYPTLRSWLLAHRAAFLRELGRRGTQTNDVRRVAPVSVALTRIPGPVALLEVGAAAGLCLFPDRFAVDLGGTVVGDPASGVHVRVDLNGIEVPSTARLPQVVWRAGLDLYPLDPLDPEDARWLETLLWPGQDARLDLLRHALAVVRRGDAEMHGGDALVRRGDAVDGLAPLAALAPPGATLVVVSTGTLVYLPGHRRQAFVDTISRLGARWISYEKSGLLDGVAATVPSDVRLGVDADTFATLALDGIALAAGDAHGTVLRGW